MYVGLPAFFSLAELVDAFDNAELFETPDGLIAIGSGGHYWLGLDYRAGAEPAVIYQETEDADIECVAASFDEFLDGLVEDE